jgi:hypothetical protein
MSREPVSARGGPTTISLLSMKTVSYKQQAVGSDILMPTPRRYRFKEGLGTGNLLDHFELIGMIDDVGVVQLENIAVLHCGAVYRSHSEGLRCSPVELPQHHLSYQLIQNGQAN